MERVLVSWSGGKDCALAMYETLVTGEYEVAALFTTLSKGKDRVDMHDIRCSLLERQARALGVPWELVSITSHESNADYEPHMVDMLKKYRDEGVSSVICGDIYRDDLRKYRSLNLARLGMKAVFPLWRRDDLEVMNTFIGLGFKAVVTSINTYRLDAGFVGRAIDRQFLIDLPNTCSLCGEYGEYHTFVYDGPLFESPIPFTVGDICERDDPFQHFMYCDLIPA